MNRRAFLASLGVGLAAVKLGGTLPASEAPAAMLDAPFMVGDMFTVAGRNAVNPITGADSGHLQWFTVTSVEAESVTFRPHFNGAQTITQDKIQSVPWPLNGKGEPVSL